MFLAPYPLLSQQVLPAPTCPPPTAGPTCSHPHPSCIPPTNSIAGPTWLVEVRRQLSGHSSRDVTLLAGGQRGLVCSVGFGSRVGGPTEAQRVGQQEQRPGNYTGPAKMVCGAGRAGKKCSK